MRYKKAIFEERSESGLSLTVSVRTFVVLVSGQVATSGGKKTYFWFVRLSSDGATSGQFPPFSAWAQGDRPCLITILFS